MEHFTPRRFVVLSQNAPIALASLAAVDAYRDILLGPFMVSAELIPQRFLPLCGIVCADLSSYSSSAVGIARAEVVRRGEATPP